MIREGIRSPGGYGLELFADVAFAYAEKDAC
jgi:hypothetical protein